MLYLGQTLFQYLLQQNHIATGQDKTIEREEDMGRYVVGMPLLADLCLAILIDPLILIKGVSEFVTVIYSPTETTQSLTQN